MRRRIHDDLSGIDSSVSDEVRRVQRPSRAVRVWVVYGVRHAGRGGPRILERDLERRVLGRHVAASVGGGSTSTRARGGGFDQDGVLDRNKRGLSPSWAFDMVCQ
jgi:hypothetical protein